MHNTAELLFIFIFFCTVTPILKSRPVSIGWDSLGNPWEVGALFTTVSSIRVSRVGRVSSVSVMVSVRDSVK